MESDEANFLLSLAQTSEAVARLEIINSRLLAWQITGDAIWTPLVELFDTAGRRDARIMDDTLAAIDNDMENAAQYVEMAPVMALLEAFEQALDDLDKVLMEVDS